MNGCVVCVGVVCVATLMESSAADVPGDGLTSTDQKLLLAARTGDVRLLKATVVAASGPGLESALKAAISNRQAAAVLLLLGRGALATAIGAFSSALHRPGVTVEGRIDVMLLLLDHYRDTYVQAAATEATASARARDKTAVARRLHKAYGHVVSKVLLAGAAQREGPLLLAAAVRAGHVAAALDASAPGDDAGLAAASYKKALQLNKKAISISWSVARAAGADAIVCDQVRVPVRRHYSGYTLAQQQLHLCAAGVSSCPWSVLTHRHYPRPFRVAARCVLLCWRREPLCKLPHDCALVVLEHLAALTFWTDPAVDLLEGEEIGVEHGQPLSKLPSYKAL